MISSASSCTIYTRKGAPAFEKWAIGSIQHNPLPQRRDAAIASLSRSGQQSPRIRHDPPDHPDVNLWGCIARAYETGEALPSADCVVDFPGRRLQVRSTGRARGCLKASANTNTMFGGMRFDNRLSILSHA